MRYISLADLKTALGISGSTYDTYLSAQIKRAEARVDSMLSVNRLDLHKVSDEIHDADNTDVLYLDDLHIVAIGEILDDETEYTQDEAYDIDNYVLHLEDALVQGKRKAHVTYAAGWNAGGLAKITISDYSAVGSGMTIELDPDGDDSDATTITEGTEWDAETDNNTTATNLAAAINLAMNSDDATGMRAFALENVVYVIDESPGREDSTIQASVVTGMSIENGEGTAGSAATDLAMNGVDFPEDIVEAVILLVGSAFTKRKSRGVKSYKVGTKSITYSGSEEITEAKSLLKGYMRARVMAV